MAETRENLTRQEAEQRARTVSDVTYDVTLELEEDGFRSHTVVEFTATPGQRTHLDLTAETVQQATLNGETITDIGPTRLAIGPLSERNRVEVSARHRYSRDGHGCHRFVDPVDGQVYLHTQFEPFDAHRVFACFDQPDIKASFRFRVRAPAGWTVLSNTPGRCVDGTWEFEPTPPLSTYVTAVVAGPFHSVYAEHDGVRLGLHCRPSLAEHLEAEELFGLTRAGLDLYRRVFELPYPFGKYDQVFVPEFAAGAMENPGCVTFNERHLFRSRVTDSEREDRADTLLHEMAHMWFGDLVTMRWWDDLWLNESFASFMATYALVHATRFRNAWVSFSDRWKAWAKHADELPTTHPIEPDVPDVESVHLNFDGITYAKGASVLRQLVAWVGEDAFFAGCEAFFRRYAYANATLADLLAALEETSGRDLGTWAEQWLRTAGINTLTPERRDGGLVIHQTAPAAHPTLREHRVGIGFYQRSGDRLERTHYVEVDVSGPHTEIGDVPDADLILVNDGDLTYAKIGFDDRSLETLEEALHGIADPLARALCWGALWDMLRDATLPAGRYLDIVGRNLGGEHEVGVLTTLLRRARSAVLAYGDPGRRTTRLVSLAAEAWAQARAAAPGSDAQLVWVRHWADCLRGEAATGALELLDGRRTLEGLTVDTELRWHLLIAAARAGADVEARIEEELERDPTDIGQRHAATARAARPDPAAKARAWQLATTDPDVSHTMAVAVAQGLVQWDQEDLLAPYLDRYFAVLPELWERRELETATVLARVLFPHPLASEELEQRALRTADDPATPAPLARVLREEADTVRRVVASRRRDAGS